VPFTINDPSSNNLVGAFTYTSTVPGVATISPQGLITVAGGGTTVIRATQAATASYNQKFVDASFVVNPIDPIFQTYTLANKNFGDVSFNLSDPSSNNLVATFTYSSSVPEVATVTSGGTVTVVGGGTTVIRATQAATTNYNQKFVDVSFTVLPIDPIFQTYSIGNKNFSDASFNINDPSSNNLVGAFTYSSSVPGVATITSAGRVTIVGGGTTVIRAIQAATANYKTKSVDASFTVLPIDPTFLTYTVANKNFGDASFNINDPSSNNLVSAFTYTNSSVPGVATIMSDGRVTVVGAGTTVFTVKQAATASYNEKIVDVSFTVLPIDPTFQTYTVASKSFGQVPFTINDPSSNNLDGVFSYINSSVPGVATISSEGLITVAGGGTTIFTIRQAATTNYNEKIVDVSFTVLPIDPIFQAYSIGNKSFGQVPFTINDPSSNNLVGAFTYTSTVPGVASISPQGLITVAGGGTTVIRATQAATANYNEKFVDASFVVNPIDPIFQPYTVASKSFGQVPFTINDPSSNNLVGAFTYTSTVPGVATISPQGLITVAGGGTTVIRATQAATASYNTKFVDASFVVNPIDPIFQAYTVASKSFGQVPFTINDPSSNNLDGAFSYTNSSVPGVATITSGGLVTVVGGGTTIFTAKQAATANYNQKFVDVSFTVLPIDPSFGTYIVAAKHIGDVSFNINNPSSNNLVGAFTYTSSTPGVATITSGGRVTITGIGTTKITAKQAATANYNEKTVDASFVITESLSNFVVSPKNYGITPYNLNDPTAADTTTGFTFVSSNTSVATISGRTVTITGVGSSVITASQAATSNHVQLDISATLVVSPSTPVITLAPITKPYGSASFRLEPTSTNTDRNGSGGVFSFSSSLPSVASIVDTSFVSINGLGDTTISISQTASSNFNASSGSVVITVIKGTPVLSTLSVYSNRTYKAAPFSIIDRPTSASDGVITYSSNNENAATIDNSGIITLVGAGYVNFTATQASTAFYESTTKVSNTMTVHRYVSPLTRVSPTEDTITKIYGDPYFIVSATNESSGAFTYETSNSSVAGIINSTTGVISVISVGTATITAKRAETLQFTTSPISWTVQVNRATTTLSGLIVDSSYNVTAAPFTVTASSPSDGAVTYALQDPSSNILTIHPTSGLVTLRSPGSAVIVASQAQGTLYEAPPSISTLITVRSAGNALQGATITSTASFANVNLNGASLSGVTITNTVFTDVKLVSANLTNAVIVSANFSNADLSGANLTGANITGASFATASLKNADLSGAVLTSTVFTNSDLSGAKLNGVDASGASFANAKLTNVDLTGAKLENVNFTNTNIKGANIADVSFSPLQKLQLLRNSDNRDIGQIIIPEVSGTTILSAISESSPLRNIANLNIENSVVSIVIPQTSTSPSDILPNVVLNVTTSDKFYLPINESEYFQIDGIKYYTLSGVVRNYITNEIVEVINYNGKSVWLLAGSLVGIVLQTNPLNTAPFVVTSSKLYTDTTPFSPIIFPTSNSTSPIVYSSNNTAVATIHPTTGEITLTGTSAGPVIFTATQVQNATYEPGRISSNVLGVYKRMDFTLAGLNQTFSLSTLALLDASSTNLESTDATSVFYVKLSNMTDLFQYQTDSLDINDISASDIKYYVFNRKWPTELKINPAHAMLNKPESAGMLGTADVYNPNKMLTKHDFLRYISLRLFNTIHGVDLLRNESDLLENATYWGENVRTNINTILSGISTTSSDAALAIDSSGNKYLTNTNTDNTNLCRELIRQISFHSPQRFANISDNSGLKGLPLQENDTISFKVMFQSASSQNTLTGVEVIPVRSYTVKLILKNDVSGMNTPVIDSEMFPTAYPYSTSVVTYAPTAASSAVYNSFSPPAPIPFTRFGFNGWYYANTSTWVNINSNVRNHIKWLLPASGGSASVGSLRYIRANLKVYNKTALPYIMVYTQSGSWRKYTVPNADNIVNGTTNSFYINFNSYIREPAIIGFTNVGLTNSLSGGSFANNELILNIAIETDSSAGEGTIEFTLSSVIIGDSIIGEKEYGFEADVPTSYP
jgi:uncharacterized protein YjbI with pentapeptide repeats